MQLIRKISRDDKNLILYFFILYLCTFLTYKVPHRPNSFIELFIPNIHFSNSTIYLGTIILIIPYVFAITGIINSERFRKRSKLLLFLAIICILLPLMRWSIDFTRTNINWLFHQELNAIDIKESNITMSQNDDEITFHVNATLIDYNRSQNHFNLRIYLPEEIANDIGKTVLDSESSYVMNGHTSKLNINETIHIPISKAILPSILLYDKNYVFQLYNEKETVEIITKG